MSDSTTARIEETGAKPADVVVRGDASGFLQEIVSGAHQLRADEPVAVAAVMPRPGLTIMCWLDWGHARR
jgi:hypothetical protein